MNVSGNLAVTGNTTYYNVSTYSIDDPLIYLAANNDVSDIVDIGFMGGKNTAGVYSHTGLARDAGDGTWYLFDNLADEGHVNNVVDFANTTLATLRANIAANSILLRGNVVATQANLTIANDQANAARLQANTARDQANTARDQANTARTTANDSYGQANSARDQANTGYAQANAAYGQANSARNQANTAYGQANDAYTQANSAYAAANVSANTVRVYANGGSILSNKFLNFVNTASIQVSVSDPGNGNANISFITTGAAVADAYGQANAAYNQANAAYGQANAAYADSNTRVLKSGDTMTGALTITTSGTGLTVANANVTNHLTVGTLNVRTNTVITSSSGQVVLDTFPAVSFASAKYFVQANSGVNYTITEIILVHDGTNIHFTEYGTIQTGPSIGTFSTDIDTGNVRLLFTANNNVNTIRSVRYGLLAP